ncbi:hypothetical protein DQX05_14375 [Paenibacillus thiaminolyticus]|uniref:Uncharacterized protein n=1 Tax=Paenibacillus thiaminolyticus TaxID=49283 RepID=A0A3A3GGJ4_PANTH|nr:hypothetical protein DQX05_14375 [Paenibacillus thiaminolyticus]
MEISQIEALLIIISFLTLYTLIVVLGIHFIFRKNILLRNYVYLGLLAIGLIVSYYSTIFKDRSNWIQSLLFTIIFIGLVRQQLIYRKKNKMNK